MRRLVLAIALLLTGCATQNAAPIAERKPVARTDPDGVVRTDDYAWLRDRDAPAVLAHLRAENAHTDRVLQPIAPLERTLVAEFTTHTKLDDSSVPYPRDGWLYFHETDADSDYPRYYRKRSADDRVPQLLLDPNELAKTLPYVDVGAFEPSDDGRLLAYTIDSTGYRQYALAIKDVATGKLLPDKAERVTGVCWSNADTLFFSTEDATTKRSNQIWRLTLGGAPVLVYEERDDRFNVGVGRTIDKAFVVITCFSYTTADCRVIPADKPTTPPRAIAARKDGVECYVVAHRPDPTKRAVDRPRQDEFLVRTNDAGKNFRLLSIRDDAADLAGARELVPHREHIYLDDANCYGGRILLTERADGMPRLALLEGGEVKPIKMPEAVCAVSLGPNLDPNARSVLVNYESLVTPPTVFSIDLETRRTKMLKQQEVPGGFDRADYEQRLLYATARDGSLIPISFVARRDRPAGPGPLLVDVYGAYGLPEWVWFEPERLSLLDRGVAFAIPHVRGGGELGETWHDVGRLLNKRTTFTDTVDAVAYLQSLGLATPRTTAISGASAGGLTVAAVLNDRPDLFRCAVLGVPFVDVVNTMLDPSLPLTTQEYLEWGDPRQADALRYIAGYSPYDNLARKDYPATLVFSSYQDSQVGYWEPAKYVAKRRALNPRSDKPLLLNLTMTGGHGGPSGRSGWFAETARHYAFVLWQLGATR